MKEKFLIALMMGLLLTAAVEAKPKIRTLVRNVDLGRIIELESGRGRNSMWEVNSLDCDQAADWSPMDRIEIQPKETAMGYKLLSNLDRDETIRVRQLKIK